MHTLTIGFMCDAQKKYDLAWRSIFDAFISIQQRTDEKCRAALLIVYNGHIAEFVVVDYSTFALGREGRYSVADEGSGARDLPLFDDHADRSRHIV